MKYKVTVVETLALTFDVNADNEQEAYDNVHSRYMSEDIVLSANDFNDVNIYVEGTQYEKPATD